MLPWVYVCIYLFSGEGGNHLYWVPGPLHGGSFNHIGLFKLEPKPLRKDHKGSNLIRFQHTLLKAWFKASSTHIGVVDITMPCGIWISDQTSEIIPFISSGPFQLGDHT
jgi:hypothetical protein